MKSIIKYSIFYLIFATFTIIAHVHDKESIVTIKTEDDLKNLLINSQGPSAISFHMDRCGWCIQMQPIFQDLAHNDQFGHITFYTANGPALKASTHVKNALNEEILGYPTILFMNQGKIIDKQIGGADKEVVTKKLHKLSSTPALKKSAKAKLPKKPKQSKAKIAAIAAAKKKAAITAA